MKNLASQTFSDHFDTLKQNKKSFIFVFLFLVFMEWVSQTITGLSMNDTPNDVAGAALLNSILTYVKWIAVGFLCVNVVTVSLKRLLPEEKIGRASVTGGLLKSLALWFMSFLLIFSLLLTLAGSSLDVSALEAGSINQTDGMTLIALLLTVSAVMFFSLVYALAMFQQYMLNNLLKKRGDKKEAGYVNGFIVPFWVIPQMLRLWKSFAIAFLIIVAVGLKGALDGYNLTYASLLLSGLPGILFALLLSSGVGRAVACRLNSRDYGD